MNIFHVFHAHHGLVSHYSLIFHPNSFNFSAIFMFSQRELNGLSLNEVFMLSNDLIHPIYFHTAITSGLKKFEEKHFSRWKMEPKPRNDHKNLIPRALIFVLFSLGFNSYQLYMIKSLKLIKFPLEMGFLLLDIFYACFGGPTERVLGSVH